MDNIINTGLNICLIILILLIIAPDNLLEGFIETATYLGKVIINEDVVCKKNVNVKKITNTNQLCLDEVCIDKNKLSYIKQLPYKLKTAICVDNTCINETGLKVIKELATIKTGNSKDVFIQLR
jgi:hypothetical protein